MVCLILRSASLSGLPHIKNYSCPAHCEASSRILQVTSGLLLFSHSPSFPSQAGVPVPNTWGLVLFCFVF